MLLGALRRPPPTSPLRQLRPSVGCRRASAMAGTRWAYVRAFEQPDPVLPHAYMVVRLDGNGFHRFSARHGFRKPNDPRALELMNAAAARVMHALKGDALLAFGESDEYSFLLGKYSQLYSRRQSKIVTHIVSLFTGAYVCLWPRFFPHTPLADAVDQLPSFDGRLVVYPSAREVRDYFSWRQADTHINNLYNTTFWALVQHDGLSETLAHKQLERTVSRDKHDILFTRGINYNDELAMFRKGSILLWHTPPPPQLQQGQAQTRISTTASQSEAQPHSGTMPGAVVGVSPTTSKSSTKRALTKAEKKAQNPRRPSELRILHVDMIGDAFWSAAPPVLPKQPPQNAASDQGSGEHHCGQQATNDPSQERTEEDEALNKKDHDAMFPADQPWLDPARTDTRITAHGLLDD